MTFRSDTAISGPPDSSMIRSRFDLGGYGWHPDHGLFIPVSEPLDYIPEPSALIEDEIFDKPDNRPVAAFVPNAESPPAATYVPMSTGVVYSLTEQPVDIEPPE